MGLTGIALFLFAGGSILLAGLAIALSGVFLLELSRVERVRRRQSNSRLDFVKTLQRQIAGKKVQDIGDVHNCYRAFFGIGILKASHLEEIAEFLRGAMPPGASSPLGASDARVHETAQHLRMLLAANQRVLEVELQCVPFSGTPEPERQLLRELSELATTDRAGGKLAALAKAIRIRQDRVEWLDRGRRRSLGLARWGWLGTVGFSVLTILLGLLALGG